MGPIPKGLLLLPAVLLAKVVGAVKETWGLPKPCRNAGADCPPWAFEPNPACIKPKSSKACEAKTERQYLP